MSARTARFRFSVDIDELISKARKGEEVLLKLGSAGTMSGKQISLGADQASVGLGRTGEAATTAAIRFQTLTQGALNLSTAFVQSYTSVSNLNRAQNEATAAAINHDRAIATLHQQELRLAKLRADSTPDLARIQNLQEKIAIQKQDIARKADAEAIAQDKVNDTYLLFGSSIVNTFVSSLQTMKYMREAHIAATLKDTFAINANTAALTGNTSAQAVNTGFLSKYVFAVGPAVAGTRALTIANGQLAFAIRGVQFALGPIGLAMIGIGAAWEIYANNVGGAKDALDSFLGIQDQAKKGTESYSLDIDKLTESYKNLNSETDKNTKKMAENLKVVREVMNEGITGYARGVDDVRSRLYSLNARYGRNPSSAGVPGLSSQVPEENIVETDPSDADLPPWIPQAYGERADTKIRRYEFENSRATTGGGQSYITGGGSLKSGTFYQDRNGNVKFVPSIMPQTGYIPQGQAPDLETQKLLDSLLGKMNRLVDAMNGKYDPTFEFGRTDLEQQFWQLDRDIRALTGEAQVPRTGRGIKYPSGSGAFTAPDGGGIWGTQFFGGTGANRQLLRENRMMRILGVSNGINPNTGKRFDARRYVAEIIQASAEAAAEAQQEAMEDPSLAREFIKRNMGIDIGNVAGSIPFSEAIRIAGIEKVLSESNGHEDLVKFLGGSATQAFQTRSLNDTYQKALSGGGMISISPGNTIQSRAIDRARATLKSMGYKGSGRTSSVGGGSRRGRGSIFGQTIGRLFENIPSFFTERPLGTSLSVRLESAQRIRSEWNQLLNIFNEAGISPDVSPTISGRGGKGEGILYYSRTAEQNFTSSLARANEILRQRYDVAYGQPLGLTRAEVRTIYFNPERGESELQDRIRYQQRQSAMSSGLTL